MSATDLGGPLEKGRPSTAGQQRSVAIERQLEQLSRLMDSQFQIPLLGWRFGLNAIIDLIPGIGDAATSLVALYVLASAVRYRVPKITLLRMGINIAVYFLFGLLPWLGDLFDAWWKPNLRNIVLLRRSATVSATGAHGGRASDWIFVSGIMLFLLALLTGSLMLTYIILRFVAHSIAI
ncbi:MAG TPA: hypothetical protein DCK99_07225 [Blastocatellia bacterium]|nr:hypothetical protein [Blastocatellia bacterium]